MIATKNKNRYEQTLACVVWDADPCLGHNLKCKFVLALKFHFWYVPILLCYLFIILFWCWLINGRFWAIASAWLACYNPNVTWNLILALYSGLMSDQTFQEGLMNYCPHAPSCPPGFRRFKWYIITNRFSQTWTHIVSQSLRCRSVYWPVVSRAMLINGCDISTSPEVMLRND